MTWSGGLFTRTNGVFSGSLVWLSDASAGIDILADRHDVHDQDLAAGINACLNRNGQNSPTTNISWGGWKITGIGNGTAPADAAAFGQTITGFTFSELTRVLTGARSAGNLTVTIPLPTETGHGLVPPLGVPTGRVLTDSGAFVFLNASTVNAGTFGVDRIPSLPPSKLSSGGATDTQVLVWSAASNAYVPASPASGGVVVWGAVIGTLDNQADVVAALGAKASLSGAAFTGPVTLSGETPWDTGNFDPDTKANLSGAAFTSESVTLAGELAGFRGVPLTTQATGYTYALADSGKGARKDTTSAHTYTIPPNSTVAFPVGTILTAVNNAASGNISLSAGAGVTFRLAGTTTTGTRTVAPRGYATAFQVAANVWLVSGPGVT